MKRNSVLKLLTASLAVAAAFGGVAALNPQTASASTNKFEMDTVAAVRVDKQGIRFYAHFDETTKAQAEQNGYGFLVFPQDYLKVGTADEITGDYHTKLTKFVEIEGTKAIYQNDDGVWTANGVITEVLETSFDIPFTCVAYIGNETDGYTYATIDENFSRSSYQVASAAYIKEADKRATLLTTYKTKYGFGSDDKPVLIQDYKDLELISAAVTGGETFKDVQFVLNDNITLRNSYAPIPAAFEGTIDGNGKTVTANFEVAVVEDAADLTGTIDENPVIPTKLVDVAIEPELIGKATNSQKKELVTKADYTADGITGDYTGNALKFYGDELQTTVLKYYLTTPEYSTEEIETLKNTYDYVTMWLAKAGAGTAFGGLYNNTQTSAQDSSFTSNAWHKYTISVEEYFALTATYPNPYIVYTWQEKATSPNAIMYIGDIEFGFDVPSQTIAAITSEGDWSGTSSKGAIWHADYYTRDYFISAEEMAAKNFGTNYTGNAMESQYGGKSAAVNNAGYWRFNWDISTLTANQINYLKTNYTHVRFYAAVADVSEAVLGTAIENWYFGLGGGIMHYAEEATSTTDAGVNYYRFDSTNDSTWVEFNVPIEDFLEYANGKTQIDLFNRTASSRWGNWYEVYIYTSDIQFVKKSA